MTKILLIEDEDSLRNEVAEWLTFEGFEVITAADGVEGANAASSNLPDIIICDIMMPGLDGYGVLLHVRANSLTQQTPIIFTTALVSHEDIRKGMSLGADDYLTKPFTIQELLDAISVQLDKREAQKRELALEVDIWRQSLSNEREQHLLKAKMVAMFVHDFRNPLTAIMSSICIVRDYADRIDEDRRLLHLNRALTSTEKLVDMLDDMLFLAQVDSGSLDLMYERLDINQFIKSVLTEFETVYGDTHHFLFANHFADIVMVEPRSMRQIISNLVSNAVKYSPPGSKVHIMLNNQDDHYVLTIQDHGVGIPEEEQLRLFDAFERGSNVGKVSGTGLGLAIVQRAVDALGGFIEMESRIGVGTTIAVYIPVSNQDTAAS